MHAGEMPAGTSPGALATVIVGCVRGVVLQWLLDSARVSLAGAAAEVRRTLELAFARNGRAGARRARKER
jgi:hypothetical protein